MYVMTPGDENIMLSVIYHYVVSLDREVYLIGKGSDVHEGIISKGNFSISVWYLVVCLIQYCYCKQKEFLDESSCVHWVKKVFLVS
jgi:hypothetical protein